MNAEDWVHSGLAALIIVVGLVVWLLYKRGDRFHRETAARLDAIESEVAEHRASVERDGER